MAMKRMFTREVIEQLDFDNMSDKAKLGYIYLCLNADDDGFVVNPKKLGINKRTVEVMEKAGYIYRFSNGVVLIRHWFVHNNVRKDMYKPTPFTEQKALVILDSGKVYQLKSVTEQGQICTESVPQSRVDQNREDQNRKEKINIDQNRLEERRIDKGSVTQTVAEPTAACDAPLSDIDKENNFNVFWEKYPNKTDRETTKIRFMELDADFGEIMEGLDHHLKCAYWVNDGGDFIPKPFNWLTRRQWLERPPLHRDHKNNHEEKPPCGAHGDLGEEELLAIRRAMEEERL